MPNDKNRTNNIKPKKPSVSSKQTQIKQFTERKKSVTTNTDSNKQESAKKATVSDTSAHRAADQQTDRKKRDPPTPPENPSKKRHSMSTPESSNPPENPTLDNTELSDELKRLRELLNSDIDKKFDEKLQPLKDSISTLEKSQQNFKEQSLKVTKIEAENVKLRENCESIKKENEKLKLRLSAIEDKLLENHIILQGIPDQVWELKDVTREKVMHALAEVANGDTHQKKLDIVRKISINTVRHIGDYSKYRNRPVCVEFTNKTSADFLMENKRKLKKGIYADRSYSDEINSARRKLMPILRKARSMEEYKGKCMLDGKYLVIKGKKYSI